MAPVKTQIMAGVKKQSIASVKKIMTPIKKKTVSPINKKTVAPTNKKTVSSNKKTVSTIKKTESLIKKQPPTVHEESKPVTVIRVSGRISKPPARVTRNSSKPLISYTPKVPTEDPAINMMLLRNKLRLICRKYMASSLLHEALADGLYSRAEHWITPSSQNASKFGKKKRYYVLETRDFTFQAMASSWEARTKSGGSQPIDAGNGVVVFVRERVEWDDFLTGYRRQGRRAGQLMSLRQKDTEREWRDAWKRTCGIEEGEGRKKDVNAGPMWILVKGAVAKIVRGEA